MSIHDLMSIDELIKELKKFKALGLDTVRIADADGELYILSIYASEGVVEGDDGDVWIDVGL